ncbi:NACHT domain-containing protein [Leptolyngbyaceae cyanobacterium CCMR0082]|uniref:NACHT domain-containing protein n=1 Tax=Adonisia turfae CCMR0082 TaxID=2304604 RepID=A0A6M0S2L9_9CYAN|nr:NACHT domain-containing protein [Adonisia turfae]NEZ62687.1 NACHT domain-containing protein [Adonisia turfae CCMR0082]
MIESAIGGIAVPLFEQLWKAGVHLVGQIHEARQDVRDIEQVLKASQNYHLKYENRHGQVKVMPGLMKEPVPLASIYTAVKFLDEDSICQFASPDDLEQLYRDQGKRNFQTTEKRHDGITIAKEKQYLMVLGGPGVGKSTFLRKLGLEALKGQQGQLQREQIPVFIELKTFRRKTIDLAAVIAKEFKICGFPNARDFTKLSLDQGKLLILLDGLDEVPTENVNQIIDNIESFAIQHDKNTFIASCRTAAYRSSFQQFTDVTIADFDDEQIEQFTQRWFNSELDQQTDTANKYWKLLQQSNNKAVKELAHTPLLLTFLCLVYEREQTLPNRRSTLYGRALSILLSEWSAQKRLEQSPIYKDFHPELEKELLSDIAYNSITEDRLFFSKSDITNRISTFLADTLDAPAHLNGAAVLQAIEVQQGIIVERATDTYSFSHLTLQEYLTALYIFNNQLTSELVSQHLSDQRWREVFLLVVGLMGRRGHELLHTIYQQTKTDINAQPKIRSLVQWAEQATQGPPSEYKKFAKIATAIAIASTIASIRTPSRAIVRIIKRARIIASDRVIGRTIAIASAIKRAVDSAIDRDSANAINSLSASVSAIYLNDDKLFNTSEFQELPNQLLILRENMYQLSKSSDEWPHHADKLESTFLKALGLTAEDVSLSTDDWKRLDDYLYANELLLSCKQSSISISRKAWETLEERLLTV